MLAELLPRMLQRGLRIECGFWLYGLVFTFVGSRFGGFSLFEVFIIMDFRFFWFPWWGVSGLFVACLLVAGLMDVYTCEYALGFSCRVDALRKFALFLLSFLEVCLLGCLLTFGF